MLAGAPSAILPTLPLALLPLLLALLLAFLALLLAFLLALLSPILPTLLAAFLPAFPSPITGTAALTSGSIATSTGLFPTTPSSAAFAGLVAATSISSAHAYLLL